MCRYKKFGFYVTSGLKTSFFNRLSLPLRLINFCKFIRRNLAKIIAGCFNTNIFFFCHKPAFSGCLWKFMGSDMYTSLCQKETRLVGALLCFPVPPPSPLWPSLGYTYIKAGSGGGRGGWREREKRTGMENHDLCKISIQGLRDPLACICMYSTCADFSYEKRVEGGSAKKNDNRQSYKPEYVLFHEDIFFFPIQFTLQGRCEIATRWGFGRPIDPRLTIVVNTYICFFHWFIHIFVHIYIFFRIWEISRQIVKQSEIWTAFDKPSSSFFGLKDYKIGKKILVEKKIS